VYVECCVKWAHCPYMNECWGHIWNNNIEGENRDIRKMFNPSTTSALRNPRGDHRTES
jgi:hypothetical protein